MTKQTKDVQTVIDELATKGVEALDAMANFTQEQVDHIVHQAAIAALDKHMYLAKLAVDETGRGIYEDKAIKNMYASEYIWNSIKYDKTVGVIAEDKEQGLVSIAEPVGVICGVTPTTNPTSTTIFKALIALKTRNSIVFAFHPSAQKSSAEAARIVRDAAIEAGAPKNCIQWIEEPSIEATGLLMNHPKIATVLATGGPGMVKAAYSTGKPALGVGAGNVPAYIAADAKVKRAVNDIILSKSFDNGMICASEQAAIVDAAIYDEVKAEFEAHQCVIISKKADIAKLEKVVLNEARTAVNGAIVGHSAIEIAEKAGLKVPAGTKLLLAEIPDATMEHPLALEKLSPVLALIKSDGVEDGFKKAEGMLNLGGLGHTAVIHTENEELQLQYGIRMKACRVLVNSPSAEGGIGNIYNNMIPSLTLGCGSHGHNSVSHNVSSFDLLNVKTLSKRRNNMQWFRVPPKIFFEKDSITYLRHIEAERVMLVCDPGMVQFGYADLVKRQLELNRHRPAVDVFSDVEPNPSTNTVYKGLERFVDFQPDVIIALGGGSAMDAGKIMWLMYEHPEAKFEDMAMDFMDIRKRVYTFPKMGEKAYFIAIPTSSGTGSEVTPFAIITDADTGVKWPITDYELMPNMAIVDVDNAMTAPKGLTSASGIDVMTHAIEAYVSIMATDFTDGLAMKAVKAVFDYLPSAYENGANDPIAREKMANASCMAGMAFANAFLGLNHSMAHKLGAFHHLPHGIANAVILTDVMRYNAAEVPTRMGTFSQYQYPHALARYAELGRFAGCKGKTDEEVFENFIAKLEELKEKIGIKKTIKDYGIDEKYFLDTLDEMSEQAFNDQCTGANPRYPLIQEIKDLYLKCYYGK